MQGDKTLIQYLNQALAIELTAINQYFLHAKMYMDWGLKSLGKHEYDESIEEMQHADKLIERILFLQGLPNLQELGKLMIGEDVPECIDGDLQLEMQGRSLYVDAITYAEGIKDYVSRDLMQDILNDTEEHIDYLETQKSLIAATGLQNYLQTAMGSMSD